MFLAEDLNFAESAALGDLELVHFHQFEQGEEGDDHFRTGGGDGEEFVEAA